MSNPGEDLVTEGIDDLATAEVLAIRKARSLTGATYEVFAGRVGGFLRRRGFDYEIASRATRAAWDQLNAGTGPDERRCRVGRRGTDRRRLRVRVG